MNYTVFVIEKYQDDDYGGHYDDFGEDLYASRDLAETKVAELNESVWKTTRRAHARQVEQWQNSAAEHNALVDAGLRQVKMIEMPEWLTRGPSLMDHYTYSERTVVTE